MSKKEENDLTRSVGLVHDFIHQQDVKVETIPRLVKTAKINDQHEDLELVPEVYLDNWKYSLDDIIDGIQMQLRGMLSFLIFNGYFPYDKLRYSKAYINNRTFKAAKWINKRIDELFHIESGYTASSFDLKEKRGIGYTPLFRPTSTIHNIVAGWIKSTQDNRGKQFKAKSLMVSTDGEGSHTYSYITPVDFIPNSNTAVLVPKFEMPQSFLLFIAMAITKERWRYSYGRKPKGNRLNKLLLEVPINQYGEVDINVFEDIVKSIPEYSIIESYYRNESE